MRTNLIALFLLFSAFFANAQSIVIDSTKTPGYQLVAPESGKDAVLIIFNPTQMSDSLLTEAIKAISSDFNQTLGMIKTLSRCEDCGDSIPSLQARNLKNQDLIDFIQEIQRERQVSQKTEVASGQ